MTAPIRGTDFFALEAGDCLDRLDALVARPTPPDPAEMLRVTRALRGAALLANQQPMAQTIAALESVAKDVRDHTIGWDPRVAERIAHTVVTLRRLVGRVGDWTAADTAATATLTGSLEALTGPPPVLGNRGAERLELHAGVRAFVAREGAMIASALDRAAHTLRATPDARDPLYAVLRRMQSLRGLAELPDLPPLPDVLEGIELAIGDLTRTFAPPAGVPDVLDAAAQALTRVCRDVADTGVPIADAPEARRFTDLLLRVFAADTDVVPIESLFADGDTDAMRRSGGQPQFSAPEPLGPVELVSFGEHLAQSADAVERAGSGTERDLRIFALLPTLRMAAAGGPATLQESLAAVAIAGQERIADGGASNAPGRFAAALRTVGTALKRLADSVPDTEITAAMTGPLDILRRLHEVDAPTAAAERAGLVAPPPAPQAPRFEFGGVEEEEAEPAYVATEPVAAAAVESIQVESIQVESIQVESIEVESVEPEAVAVRDVAVRDVAELVTVESVVTDSVAPEPVAAADADVVPIESLFAPGETVPELRETNDIEGSYRRYARLLRLADAPVAVDDTPVVPIATLVADAPSAAETMPDTEIVDVRELCYRGRGALARAAELGILVAGHLREGADPASFRDSLDEILDLLPLALVES